MPTRTGRMVAALALALLGACGDGTGPGDVLTAAQSDALLGIVAGMASDGKTEAELAPNGTFSAVLPCLFKGQVVVSGKYKAVEDSTRATYDTDMTMVYTKCRQGTDAGVFVLEGTAREVSTDHYEDVPPSRALDSRLTGNLDWTLDKTSGSCAIDLVLAYRATTTTESSSVTGTFCGTPYPKT